MNGLTGFCTPEHYDPQQFGFRKGHSTSHALNTKLLNESHIYIKLNLNKCMCLPNLSTLVKPLIKYTTKYLYINYYIISRHCITIYILWKCLLSVYKTISIYKNWDPMILCMIHPSPSYLLIPVWKEQEIIS